MGAGDDTDDEAERLAEAERLLDAMDGKEGMGVDATLAELKRIVNLISPPVPESKRTHINVHMGEAEVSTLGKPLRSYGFANCNMYLLKNLKNGHCLMYHASFNPEDNPDQPVGIHGLPSTAMDKITPFLKEEGEKVGISIYRPWQYKSLKDHPGGNNDFGVNQYFEEQGVKMRRCEIPFYKFEANQRLRAHRNMDERQFYTFNVDYNPKDDTLRVDAYTRENKDAEMERTNLATLHPFKHPHLFEKSGFTREQS